MASKSPPCNVSEDGVVTGLSGSTNPLVSSAATSSSIQTHRSHARIDALSSEPPQCMLGHLSACLDINPPSGIPGCMASSNPPLCSMSRGFTTKKLEGIITPFLSSLVSANPTQNQGFLDQPYFCSALETPGQRSPVPTSAVKHNGKIQINSRSTSANHASSVAPRQSGLRIPYVFEGCLFWGAIDRKSRSPEPTPSKPYA
jgi:hypothetical protein